NDRFFLTFRPGFAAFSFLIVGLISISSVSSFFIRDVDSGSSSITSRTITTWIGEISFWFGVGRYHALISSSTAWRQSQLRATHVGSSFVTPVARRNLSVDVFTRLF